jgi:hypothetical protein
MRLPPSYLKAKRGKGAVPFWFPRQYRRVEVLNSVVRAAHIVSLIFLLWGEPGRLQGGGFLFPQAVKSFPDTSSGPEGGCAKALFSPG